MNNVTTKIHSLQLGKMEIKMNPFELCSLYIYLIYLLNNVGKPTHRFLQNKNDGENEFAIYLKDDGKYVIDKGELFSQEVSVPYLELVCEELSNHIKKSDYHSFSKMPKKDIWEIPNLDGCWHLTKTNVITAVYYNAPEVAMIEVGLYLSPDGDCWGVLGKNPSVDKRYEVYHFFDEIIKTQI